MLIEPRHIRPGTPAFFGWCCPLGGDTHGIKTLGITRYDGFEADVALPMGSVIIHIPGVLPLTKTKHVQRDVSRISTVAAIVLAVEVERVQMLAAPVKDDLKDDVELRQGGVAADEESAPDEWTDLAQDDAELIDAGWFNRLIHAQSVPRRALRFKMSPRYLAVSYMIARAWQTTY